MYKTVLFFYCCCFAFTSTAQNLLLNGDFEEFWECPDNTAQINLCKYVFNPYPKTTSDYFNQCWDNFNQFYAYLPYKGIGMIGLILGVIEDKKPAFFREFAQMKLKQKLKQNESVFIKFRLHKNWPLKAFPGVDTWNIISFNEIGVKFLNDSVIYEQAPWNTLQPDWVNTALQLDTMNDWTNVSFQYTAKGGEEWIMLGNFYPEQNFPFAIKDSILLETYSTFFLYLSVDQFSITRSPLPNVFTPNNDGINDVWILDFVMDEDDFRIENISIFNRWGKLIFEAGSNFGGWDGNCNGLPCSEGTYFAVVLVKNTQNNSLEKYTGHITLLR